jgi:hypothetical protein
MHGGGRMAEHEGRRRLDAIKQRRVIHLRVRFRGSDQQQSHDSDPYTPNRNLRG